MRHALISLGLLGALAGPASAQSVFEGPVPRAACGGGSEAEPPGALQGEVTAADRDSGRSLKPYTCNLELVGNDADSPGGSWQHTWYDHCSYYDTKLQSQAGTQVVDASDPTRPKRGEPLTSVAMLDPWESLSVNHRRGLLAGVYTNGLFGPLWFDVYDVTKDCSKPEMKASLPMNTIGHEGDWAPDGMTYYGSGGANIITAIDVADPTAPRPITELPYPTHGLSVSDDGNRLYSAGVARDGGNGLTIVDTSAIQSRSPAPATSAIGSVTWDDGSTAQATIPITIKGHPYVIFFDEGPLGMGDGQGATRIIDIADEAHPKVISKLKLEIQMPANGDRASETGSDSTFGYNTHYCGVPQRTDPEVVGCSNFESGMRVFDIRDPYHPREIAYFNPGGTGQAPPAGSQDSQSPVTSGYTSARVRFIRDRAEAWFTDQNKGLFITRFTNGAWPFPQTGPVPGDVGLPHTKRCLRRATVRIRVRKDARRAVVYVNGKRVKRVRGKALRRNVAVRLPKGHSVLRVVVRTRSGRRIAQTRDYTRCR
jgi:hypothetical protein